jgi:hypothetical protein
LWLIELANQRIQRALSLSSTVSLDNANCCLRLRSAERFNFISASNALRGVATAARAAQ